MKNYTVTLLLSCAMFASFISGCSSSRIETTNPENRKPEMTLRVASLDLAHYKKRIEKKDIAQLAKTLKDQNIDALTVQNISRYPGTSTRIDFVDELASRTGMRTAFGEMSNVNGHQTGNAVFSLYPILAHSVISFDAESSPLFESAVQANIDAGIGSLTLISTQLPQKADNTVLENCFKKLTANAGGQRNPLFILAGNLPSRENFTPSDNLEPIDIEESALFPIMWKIKNPSLKAAAANTIKTSLGTMIISQFDLYRPQ
jgi:hypothetical protein